MDVEDTSAEAGAVPAEPETRKEQGEETGKSGAGRIIIAALGMLAVIIGGAMSFRHHRR